MRCDKCGYDNSEYDIICENCGSPLSIEKNIELQKKYNHKNRAIDIVEIKPDNSVAVFLHAQRQIRNIMIVLVFFTCLIIASLIYGLLKGYFSKDIYKQYNAFVNDNQIGVIYFGTDTKANDYLEECLSKYDVRYLYVNTKKLTVLKKNEIRKELSLRRIKDTVVIINEKKTVNSYNGYQSKTEDEIITFLRNNVVIPLKDGDVKGNINRFNDMITSMDPAIIYLTTIDNPDTINHNEMLKSLCNDYSIKYDYITGYLLSLSQQMNIFHRLNYNEKKDNLIIFVDEGQIKQIVEGFNTREDYYKIASENGFIDEDSAKNFTNINFAQLKNIALEANKTMVLFETDNCDYCDRVKPIIGKIGLQNNLTIYDYKITTNDLLNVEQFLKLAGLKEEKLTTPLFAIFENNQMTDYMIGLIDKSLLEEKLKDLGIIR